MKITNNYNLPEPFVRLAQDDETHKPKDKWYSVTQLLKPTRQILLERRHFDEIEQDCADRIWLLFGTAIHKVLQESANGKNEFAEERLEVTLENGYTISGQIDLYNIDTGVVKDYKSGSVWKSIHNDFDDWDKQAQVYSWLLKMNGLPANGAEFTLFMKDHSKTDARNKADYPKLPVRTVKFAVTDDSTKGIDLYLRNKIDDLRTNEGVADNELPLCTEEERWAEPTKYAVMKNGRKTALRVLESMEEAEAYKAENKGDYIEERKGVDKRCENYCAACKFCDYWQKNYKQTE